MKIQIRTLQCPMCGQRHTLEVEEDDYKKYINGEGYVQTIFPYLSSDEREMLISGMCPDCWKRLF